MITSQLPPSRFLGAVAASIDTPPFKCFVSTARRFFISSRWETMVFKGDPGEDGFAGFAKFFYRPGFNRTEIHDFHSALVARIDALGETGATLTNAYAEAFMDLVNRGIAFVPDIGD